MERVSKKQMMLSIGSLSFGNLTSAIFSFCLSLYVLEKTSSSLFFSLVLLIQPVINLLFSPIVGYLVDNYNHKVICIWAQILSVALALIFIKFFNNLRSLNLQLMLIGSTIIGLAICDNFQSTAYKASAIELVIEQHQQKLVAYEQLVSASVTILAPIVGGMMYSLYPLSIIGICEVVGEILSLLLLLFLDFKLVRNNHLKASSKNSIINAFIEGISYIKHDKRLSELLQFAIFANFALAAVEVGLPVVMINKLKISSNLYGITDSFLAIGMLIISLIIGSVKIKNYSRFTGYLGIILSVVFLVLAVTSLSTSYLLVIVIFSICMLTIGMILAGVNLPYAMYIRTRVEENMQGRVGATTSSLVALLSPISYAIFGVTFNHVSPIWSFILCVIILVFDSLNLLKNSNNRNVSIETKETIE